MSNVAYFIEKFKTKSKEELQQIVEQPAHYQNDALIAAKQLLADLGAYVNMEPETIIEEETPKHAASVDNLIVSRQMRLIHYVIDYVVLQVLTVASMALINLSYELTGIYYQTTLFAPLDIANYFVLFFLYYLLLEHYGQITIGKLITKTMVVDEMGYEPSFSESLYRTLSRFIPFEAFSCLRKPSRGWHDTLSGTYVIERRNLDRFRKRLGGVSAEDHLVDSGSE